MSLDRQTVDIWCVLYIIQPLGSTMIGDLSLEDTCLVPWSRELNCISLDIWRHSWPRQSAI